MDNQVNILKPEKSEYPEWATAEIELVHYADLMEGLQESFTLTLDFLKIIPAQKLDYRYAEGKWTIQEIWQHIMDVERVLSYRTLRYARHDETVLPGFDGKNYVTTSLAMRRNWEAIIEEYKTVRPATISLFKSFTSEMLMLKGTTGKSQMTVRAVGFLILGHEMHHLNIIRERYL